MDNSIINTGNSTIIINGGNPLPGCPSDWDEARAIARKLNDDRDPHDIVDTELHWSFDCGFKLDYDGQLISVSSRFYPPTTHSGPTWTGCVTIYFMEDELIEKEFDCATPEELKPQVEQYVKEIAAKLRAALV